MDREAKTAEKFRIDQIIMDQGTQSRAELNWSTVQQYAEDLNENNAQFPPVVLFWDEDDNHYLADGFHRVEAYKKAGRKFIKADVRPGSLRDAILYSMGANSSHGLRRTNADKRRAVYAMLEDPEWQTWSDREIGRRCNVDHKMVGRIRDSLGLSPSEGDARNYMTKHGQKATMKTANIGKKAPQAAAPVPEAVEAIAHTDFADRPQEVAKLATLDPETQIEVAQVIASGQTGNLRRAQQLVTKARAGEAPPLPDGKYRVIYADPPWDYGNNAEGKGAQDHYPGMKQKELLALPVGDLAADNSVLFLWVTSPFLDDGIELINAWGFKYKSSFVWDKHRHHVAYYNSMQHEFLLIATRGSGVPDNPTHTRSVLEFPVTEHSRKPPEVRDMIATMYNGPRIELFAREAFEGWEVWGNQAPAIV